MRRLRVCILGPAALIVTTIAIVLTPLVGAAAETSVTVASDSTACQVADAEITWGVKESLRSYISGTIANGEWTVSDGASYETPNFGWSEGAGQLDSGRGTLAFDGSLRFTGHDGILDTTLTGLEIVFDGSTTAHLVFDVFGTTQDGTPVDENGVQFADINTSGVSVFDGTALVKAAPVTLTEAGSAAFGTYPAGEELDPITVTFSATSDCFPQPQAGNPDLERAAIALIAVSAVVLGAGIVFLVTRSRGTKQQPRKK